MSTPAQREPPLDLQEHCLVVGTGADDEINDLVVNKGEADPQRAVGLQDEGGTDKLLYDSSLLRVGDGHGQFCA